MQLADDDIWKTPLPSQLASALVLVDSQLIMRAFLRDVLTEKEILEISSRLEAARMLQEGRKYTDIIDRTKLSSRTIARISEWMRKGCGGYTEVLRLLSEHHGHMLPARAK